MDDSGIVFKWYIWMNSSLEIDMISNNGYKYDEWNRYWWISIMDLIISIDNDSCNKLHLMMWKKRSVDMKSIYSDFIQIHHIHFYLHFYFTSIIYPTFLHHFMFLLPIICLFLHSYQDNTIFDHSMNWLSYLEQHTNHSQLFQTPNKHFESQVHWYTISVLL